MVSITCTPTGSFSYDSKIKSPRRQKLRASAPWLQVAKPKLHIYLFFLFYLINYRMHILLFNLYTVDFCIEHLYMQTVFLETCTSIIFTWWNRENYSRQCCDISVINVSEITLFSYLCSLYFSFHYFIVLSIYVASIFTVTWVWKKRRKTCRN